MTKKAIEGKQNDEDQEDDEGEISKYMKRHWGVAGAP